MMKLLKFILALFLALVFTGHVYLHSVNIHPERATGIVGGEVQINCEVEFGPSDEMTWDFNTKFVYIITGGVEKYPQGTSKYSVQRTGMNFALTVKDLRLEDGGEYMCTSFTSEATAFLVVLDTPSITLNPNASVDGETAKVTCEARFGGPKEDLIFPGHYPKLKIYLNNSSPNDMVTANDPSEDKKHYLISMTKNVTFSARMNTRNITCVIGTDEPSMKHSGVAILNVLYSVRDINITPDQEKYKVGDIISCMADSNPGAVYEWKKVQGGTPIYGEWLNITETMIGENNWECVARNIINGEWSEKRRQRSFVVPSKSGNDSSVVTIAVVTVIVIILVIIAVAFYFKKKMKKPNQANKLPEPQSVEAYNLLPIIQQEEDGSSASENLIQPNIHQEKDGSASSEPSIEPNTQQGKNGFGSSGHSIEPNIQQGKFVFGSSKHSIERNIQPGKDSLGSSEPSIEPNIQQGKDGLGSSEHSIEPNIQQGKDVFGSSGHTIEPNIEQGKDGLSSSEHSNGKNILQGKYGFGSSEHSIEPNTRQGKNGFGSSGHTIEPNIQQGKFVFGSSKHSIEPNIQPGKDSFGSSEQSIKSNIQPGKDGFGSSNDSIQPNIHQGNYGFGSAQSIEVIYEKPEEPKLGICECIELLKSVKNKHELDLHGKQILRLLQKDRKSILENYPDILMGLIQKVCDLIDSEYYEDIIKVVSHGSEDSPLKHLLYVMRKEDTLKKLLKNQNKLLSVIKIIASYGVVQYRTECLNYIIFIRKYTSGREDGFEWSEEYLSTLKDLLEKGADATWFNPEEKFRKREERATAQTEFFCKIFCILWEKNELYESLLQVLPLMLSKKCTNTECLRGTLLHTFVEPRWNYIATNHESMPPNFFHHFKDILRKILRHEKTLVFQKDCYGRTPVQCFLIGIELEESIFGDVREIIQMLQSPEVLSAENVNGQNALHLLAKGFPVIQGEVTQSGRESLLELVKSFANESNVGSQDKTGNTALHILAEKFPSKISRQSREVYQDFVKHLSTYDILEIKDKDGYTVLHILAENFTFEIEDWAMETFFEVIKCLAVPCNIGIQDKEGFTALQIIHLKSYNKVPEHYKDKLEAIMNILSGK